MLVVTKITAPIFPWSLPIHTSIVCAFSKGPSSYHVMQKNNISLHTFYKFIVWWWPIVLHRNIHKIFLNAKTFLETSNFLTGSYGCNVLVNLFRWYVCVRIVSLPWEKMLLMSKVPFKLESLFCSCQCNRIVLGITVLFFPNECKCLTNQLIFPSTDRERKKHISKWPIIPQPKAQQQISHHFKCLSHWVSLVFNIHLESSLLTTFPINVFLEAPGSRKCQQTMQNL